MVTRSALETERRDATALDDAALADLPQHFRGELIRPGDTQYDAARAIWNGAIDRRPGSSRAAPAPSTSGLPSVSRASAICSSPCEAAATTSPAPRWVTAAS